MAKRLARKSELKLSTNLLAYKKKDFENINGRINELHIKSALSQNEYEELHRLQFRRAKHIKQGTHYMIKGGKL